MSEIKDMPGRRILLMTIVDRERNLVQIIRNLVGKDGNTLNSGNMGWMPLDEYRRFLSKEMIRSKENLLLIEQFEMLDDLHDAMQGCALIETKE